VRSDFDRPPIAVGQIEVDVTSMLGEADMDSPLGPVELCSRRVTRMEPDIA
jgi:hypothetical protein